jgi:hypothetical protein
MEKVRNPAVAGFFYPGDEASLLRMVDTCLADAPDQTQQALVAVSPHAGYMYSGKVAGDVLSRVNIPNRIVILGPKHHSGGDRAAISAADVWRFPFGEVPIDKALADRVANETNATYDDAAHVDEHSLELQVPLLWRRNRKITITPIALGSHRIEELETFGRGLAAAVKKTDEPVLIVASTDMSHHIPAVEAERLDNMAIDRVLALDPSGLYDTVVDNRISMCGFVPTTAAIYAAKALGAKTATLVRYTNSGEVSGDMNQVVGYAGLIISK